MLTDTQMKTYTFIQRRILLDGRAPTYRQIAATLGISVGCAYAGVKSICNRGWLCRDGRKITIARPTGSPTTTDEFDYFVLDYEHPTNTGWPRLVDLA